MRKFGQEQTRAAAPLSRFRGDHLTCFDRLPAPLRAAYHQSVVDWCPLQVRWNLNKLLKMGMAEAEAVELMVEACAESDADEMAAFGRALPRVFGGISPHLAAGATVQPYGRRA